jgi:hypothetical protein
LLNLFKLYIIYLKFYTIIEFIMPAAGGKRSRSPSPVRGLGTPYSPSSPTSPPTPRAKRARPATPPPPPAPYKPKNPDGYKNYFSPNFQKNHLLINEGKRDKVDPSIAKVKKSELKDHARDVQARRKRVTPHIPKSSTIGLTHAEMKEFKHSIKDPDVQKALRGSKEAVVLNPAFNRKIVSIGVKRKPDHMETDRPEYLRLGPAKVTTNAKGKVKVGHFAGVI